MSSVYLERYAVQRTFINPSEYGHPGIVMVIPCHKEPFLIDSLNAIENCHAPKCDVTVIVVINASESHSPSIHHQNEKTLSQSKEWASDSSRQFDYHFILENELPKKHAGVGLARKMGMDEAVRIFESKGHDGVILCFDADSVCVPNLLEEVERLFKDEKVPGCSIHYEHPLEGELSNANYAGVINYELHLRYYIDALKYAGFPYAYHTIGSSMAVRSSAYQKQGGMNRRKAGEDFYFLHRIIPLGNFKNLNSTKIIPSPRSSDRVPFGTGRAIGDWLNSDMEEWQTYNPHIFDELKTFFDKVDSFFEENSVESIHQSLSPVLRSFISEIDFCLKLKEIKTHSTTLSNFQRRFYQWFDGFKVLKFVHHARDHGLENIEIDEAADWIFEKFQNDATGYSKKEKLLMLRKLDKEEALIQ